MKDKTKQKISRMFNSGQESHQSNFSTNELDQICDGPTTRELSSLLTVGCWSYLLLLCTHLFPGAQSQWVDSRLYLRDPFKNSNWATSDQVDPLNSRPTSWNPPSGNLYLSAWWPNHCLYNRSASPRRRPPPSIWSGVRLSATKDLRLSTLSSSPEMQRLVS